MPEAVPSIFPGCPAHLTKETPVLRSTVLVSSESRHTREQQLLSQKVENFFKDDEIKDFEHLSASVGDQVLPSEVLFLKVDNTLVFYQVLVGIVPTISFSLTVDSTLQFQMTKNNKEFSRSKLDHITKEHKISTWSVLLNILAFLKNVEVEKKQSIEDSIEDACKMLDIVCQKNDTSNIVTKVAFLVEQLRLAAKAPKQRRYGGSVLSMAYHWHQKSPALYRTILAEDVLSLPSASHLKRLSTAISVDLGFSESTKTYLKARERKLNDQEKIVGIVMDEVYSQKKVEYMNGKFFGKETGHHTKTILAVMISSVAGKYKDIVALLPLSGISAEIMEKLFFQILKGLGEIGFQVCHTSLDGHAVNIKFYKLLSAGDIQSSIKNPNSDQQIFLLFDTVHLFKNFYNNFVNKGQFVCDDMEGNTIRPNFAHIKKVFELELNRPVKFAHKLNDKCLFPQQTEKMSTSLAESVFHESTIAALEFYGDQFPDFRDTAKFLRIIRIWWNVVNVRTPTIGLRKRDPTKNFVSSNKSSDDSEFDPLLFLHNFTSWLQRWQQSKEQGTNFNFYLRV